MLSYWKKKAKHDKESKGVIHFPFYLSTSKSEDKGCILKCFVETSYVYCKSFLLLVKLRKREYKLLIGWEEPKYNYF